MNGFVDMHIHTCWSDGTMTVVEVINKCIENNVEVMSITDHNEIRGAKEAFDLAKKNGITCISGVELDVIENNVNYHVLGYGMDLSNDLFVKNVVENNHKLELVNIALLKKLTKFFKEVSLEEYNQFNYDRRLGGWKLLHYLMHKGITNSLLEGILMYQKYDHSYTCIDFPNISEVCDWIHDAGGVAVLAHPGKVIKNDEHIFKKELEKLLLKGLDGIECIYPGHSCTITKICIEIAKRNNLIITSGSDCHGDFEDTYIGEMNATLKDLSINNILL